MKDEPQKPERIAVSIEWAKPSDARKMAELKIANVATRGHTPKTAEKELGRVESVLAASSADDHYLVARAGAEIVGFCRKTWSPEDTMYQLQQFYVDAKYMRTGMGIGSQLMQAFIREAKTDTRARGVFLFTGDYNRHAQEMYQHWGFDRPTIVQGGVEQVDTSLDKVEDTVIWLKFVLNF